MGEELMAAATSLKPLIATANAMASGATGDLRIVFSRYAAVLERAEEVLGTLDDEKADEIREAIFAAIRKGVGRTATMAEVVASLDQQELALARPLNKGWPN